MSRWALMQEDAHEFLSFVLSNLNSEMEQLVKAGSPGPTESSAESSSQWETKGKKNRKCHLYVPEVTKTAITEIFGFQMRVTLQKSGIGHDSGQLEPYSFFLSVDIDPYAEVQPLSKALRATLRPERVEGVLKSSSSGLLTDGNKATMFESLPHVLILHLKRFHYLPSGKLVKNHSQVSFESEMVLPDTFLAHKQVAERPTLRTYQLFSVISHLGPDPTRGHYVCETLPCLQDAQWFTFDDDDVLLASRKKILSRAHSAYLLFYVRKPELSTSSS